MKTISIGDIPGVLVGHQSDLDALTGCSAIVFPQGATAGHIAFGAASGTRELECLRPRHLVEQIHAICLSGGSAFGLAAASGVMRRLEREGIGHQTSCGRVPIVTAAVVYDLNLGDPSTRPDEIMGEAAADQALAQAQAASGNVGAGTGVSSGKILGVSCATKTGLGHGGISTPSGLKIAAMVVANPVGDILHQHTGKILAGARKAPDSMQLAGSAEVIRAGLRCDPLHNNTTLGVVATNAKLSRVEAEWMAEQALVAFARYIDPPFTRHDGDVVYCVSVGNHPSELHQLGLLAREALAAALMDACYSAQPAGGLPCCQQLASPNP